MSIGNVSIDAVRLSGERTELDEHTLAGLRAAHAGPVLIDGDDGYDEARIIFNAAYDRRPAIIAQCAGTADVVAAVDFAREHDLLTAVRGGGHGIPGFAILDDGLVIDLRRMNAVLVDPANRVARVQGGAKLGDLDRETQVHGLVVPAGVVSDTGVGGLTLGGGLGWLHRKWGLSCDCLRSVEIVTADGSVLRASPERHADLFWAVRGGGGNFGIVTEFEFDAFELGPIVSVGIVAYPLQDADTILPRWRDWTTTIPDEVTSRVIMFTPPDHPSLPPELLGRAGVVVGALYAGAPEDAGRHLEPIRGFGSPIVDMSAEMPFRVLQTSFDLIGPGELGGYWKSAYVQEMTDEFLQIVARRAQNRPTPQTVSQLITMGGAVDRPAAADTAFGERGAPYMVSAESVWFDPADEEACTTWAREFIGEAEALGIASGTYLNFSGESTEALRRAQFGENLDRLTAVKRRYDPHNRFRANSNIPPD